jgi:hypothetical protein
VTIKLSIIKQCIPQKIVVLTDGCLIGLLIEVKAKSAIGIVVFSHGAFWSTKII